MTTMAEGWNGWSNGITSQKAIAPLNPQPISWTKDWPSDDILNLPRLEP